MAHIESACDRIREIAKSLSKETCASYEGLDPIRRAGFHTPHWATHWARELEAVADKIDPRVLKG